jgi:glutaredoxin
MKTFLLIALLAIANFSHAAQYYEWTDEHGVRQFTQHPPPPNVKQVQQKSTNGNVIDTGGLGYEMDQAKKNFPVTLYANGCDPCKSARAYLQKRGIPFADKNPEQKEVIEEFRNLSGGDLQVPTLVVGTLKPVVGYSAEAWGATLEQAGYPKVSP